MGFGVCKCRACRHLWKNRDGKRIKHRKNPYRANVYRAITKKLRQAKHKEELPNRLFNVMRYTD